MRTLFLLTIFSLVSTISSNAKSAENTTALESAPQMIAVDVKLIEISGTKLREVGFDFDKFDGQGIQTLTGLEAFDEMSVTGAVGLVDALLKNNLGRILANPRITTLDHQSASLATGSDVDVKGSGDSHFVRFGTQLDVEPTLLAGGKVQLAIRLQWSGSSSKDPKASVRGNRRNYEIQTSIALHLGESTLLARTLQVENKSDNSEEVIYLLVVTPELIESTAEVTRTISK